MQTAERKQIHWLVVLGVWIAFYAAFLAVISFASSMLHQCTLPGFFVINAGMNVAVPTRGRGAFILLTSLVIACMGGGIGAIIYRDALGVPFVHWYGTTITLFFAAYIVRAGWFLKTNPTEPDALAGQR